MLIAKHPMDLNRHRPEGRTVGFVPTMGNLHSGHLALVGKAKEIADEVWVSIYVNRAQFAPNEDFDRYPRTLEEDLAKLRAVGTSAVFLPEEESFYPRAQTTVVTPGNVAKELEGVFRPHFFPGVCTVVLKLFMHTQPAFSIFGKKDYQQLRVIEQMVRELSIPVKILGAPIVRESDGLAMSSRNAYLDQERRREAPQLYAALRRVADGEWTPLEAAENLRSRGWRPDYIDVRRQSDLKPAVPEEPTVVLGAAWLGGTRLIDAVERP